MFLRGHSRVTRALEWENTHTSMYEFRKAQPLRRWRKLCCLPPTYHRSDVNTCSLTMISWMPGARAFHWMSAAGGVGNGYWRRLVQCRDNESDDLKKKKKKKKGLESSPELQRDTFSPMGLFFHLVSSSAPAVGDNNSFCQINAGLWNARTRTEQFVVKPTIVL